MENFKLKDAFDKNAMCNWVLATYEIMYSTTIEDDELAHLESGISIKNTLQTLIDNDKTPHENMLAVFAFLDKLSINHPPLSDSIKSLKINPLLFAILDNIELFKFHTECLLEINSAYKPEIIWRFVSAIVPCANCPLIRHITTNINFVRGSQTFSSDCVSFLIEHNIHINEKACEMAASYDNVDILKQLRCLDPPCPWNNNTFVQAKRSRIGMIILDIMK